MVELQKGMLYKSDLSNEDLLVIKIDTVLVNFSQEASIEWGTLLYWDKNYNKFNL